MASVPLIFKDPATSGAVAHLVFGEISGTPPTVTANIRATLGGVSVRALVLPPVSANIRATLGGVTVKATTGYDNRVTHWLDFRAAVLHNPATPATCPIDAHWQTSKPAEVAPPVAWQPAQDTFTDTAAPWGRSIPTSQATSMPHGLAVGIDTQATVASDAGIPVQISRAMAHEIANALGIQAAAVHQAAIARLQHRGSTWQIAIDLKKQWDAPAGASLRPMGRSAFVVPWQVARAMTLGHPATVVVPVVPPVHRCYVPSGHLVLRDPWTGSAHLVFRCDAATPNLPPALFRILPARFYMTSHTIYAQRLPDLADVPIFAATVSADAGSYCWTLSASGPVSLFDLLAPVDGLPVQLRVTMDGIPWVFAVDGLNRSNSFGKSGVSISGRSVTALIGAPYLRATTRDNTSGDRLAQQLASDALELTGVALDWGLTDWLVPAGAWSHSGTPLDAVQTIAQAAGGYLQSHRSAPTLLTRHPYSQRVGDNPGAPWGWMTGPADVELAPDAILTEGLERKCGPDINAVYVSGTTQGVLGLVKRTGTAADKLAAMVSDALITHADAARQRGLSILGAAGPQYNVRLELPVLTGLHQPGVLEVGQLVQINAAQPWRGRVRSVSVTAQRPSLRQSVTLERHLEAV